MRIIVTGGAGFIGSWVSEAYVKAGHTVAVFDNFSTGKRSNIPSGVEIFEGDITSSRDIDRAFSAFQPEVLNLHAAHVDVVKSTHNPIHDAQQNIMGTLRLLESAKKIPTLRRIIFASTGGALFDSSATIAHGEESPVNPLSPYGISKLACELYINQFGKTRDIAALVLRYANVYGPRQMTQGESGVVSVFFSRAAAGHTCYVYGSGDQTRDFVFVHDVSRANLAALNGPEGVYHIGTGVRTSVNSLVELMRRANIALRVEYTEERPGEVQHSTLNNTKAKRFLSWEPLYQLEQGLRETWSWQIQHNVTV